MTPELPYIGPFQNFYRLRLYLSADPSHAHELGLIWSLRP